MDNLIKIYDNHVGKVSDKWSSYLDHYDKLLTPFRNDPISILEIGVQNGGSLEIWSEYFPNAKNIIGCDINPRCSNLQYNDTRVSIVVGDICEKEVKTNILSHSPTFDIIIDDGSHTSADIIETFLNFWPALQDEGIYIIEDLHCSYWLDYDGGVNNPFSAVSFFKNMIDVVNFDSWGIGAEKDYFFQAIKHRFPQNILQALENIYSVQFMDSMCVIRKKCDSKLGVRVIAGQVAEVDNNVLNFDSEKLTPPGQKNNIWSAFSDALHPIYGNLVRADKDMMLSKLSLRLHNDTADGLFDKKETRKTVALVIPYYNGSDFIDRCIDSAVAQSIKYDEIIIVDDGSEPEHSNYLKKFADIPSIKILRKKNGGQGSARNYGARNTSSDFICFIDQDDFLLPIHNKVLSAELSKSPEVGYVYGDVVEADRLGNIMRHGMIKDHALHPKNHIIHFLGEDCFILPSASMITREAFLAVDGFDPQFTGYEDDDLFMRFWLRGYKGKFIDYPIYVWCIHSASTSYSIKMSRSRLRYVKKLHNLFPTNPSMARYWFRDQIFPRFYPTFMNDVLKYINDPAHADEVIHNLYNLLELAEGEFVCKRKIRKIRIFLLLARVLPTSVFERVVAIVRRYRIVHL